MLEQPDSSQESQQPVDLPQTLPPILIDEVHHTWTVFGEIYPTRPNIDGKELPNLSVWPYNSNRQRK